MNPAWFLGALVFGRWPLSVCCSCFSDKQAKESRADGARDWRLCISKSLRPFQRSGKCLNVLLHATFSQMLRLSPISRWVPTFMLEAPLQVFKKDKMTASKYRQLADLKPVHAELMLHWAVSRQYFGSVLVPIAKWTQPDKFVRWNPR